MGQRRQARELAFLALYQSDLLGEPALARLNELLGEHPRPPEVVEFARRVVESIDHHRPAVDRAIRETSPRWELERMAATDRAVLRQAVAEILFLPGVPEVVTINEAIEIAKRFGGEESGRFVNGVLDAIRRRVTEGPPETAAMEEMEGVGSPIVSGDQADGGERAGEETACGEPPNAP